MKVMVIVKATRSSEAGELPSEQLLTAMGEFNRQLVEAGVMKAGEGLKPSSEAKRVRFHGPERTVTDGPFAETKELIAGYWLWEVDSMQDAVEWVKRCPNPMLEDSDIDIRPLYEMEDFAEQDPQGTIGDQENALKRTLSLQGASVQPYLFFGGRCEEAMDYYARVLDAKVIMKMRFDESPDAVPEGTLQAGFENKIMHASFTIGTMTLMASDGCDDKSKFDGFRLTLSVSTESAADLAFDGLAAGGHVDMPLCETFWAHRYGMVTDKFGLGWMVTVPGEMRCD